MAGEPGPGVDAAGRPVVDPTQNVLDLVRAESRRQDDLRIQAERFAAAQVQHAREMSQLRDRHVADMLIAESKRVDALRAGDQSAIQSAADRVETTATTLATVMATQTQALTKQIADLQRWQAGQQGSTAQVAETRQDRRLDNGQLIAVVSTLIAAIAIAVTLILALNG